MGSKIIKLTPQTGGVLQPNQVIGRDHEVNQLINILRKQSINLNAVRRFGKSSLLFKLNEALSSLPDFESIYIQIEGLKTCESFIEKLYQELKKEKLIKAKSIEKINEAFESIFGGIGISKTKIPTPTGPIELDIVKRRQVWEKQFHAMLQELVKANPNKIIVISLDEFSIMLDKIEDKGEASELIGILRGVMHTKPFKDSIRFIYCGSIGLDLVLDKLKKAGNNIGQPLNHMDHFKLNPLTDENALLLAQCFDAGCELNLPDELLKNICELSEHIPYYIDILFSLIRYKKPINKEVLEGVYELMLNDPNDRFEFEHFIERIELHYPNKEISLLILNFLSKDKTTISEKEINNAIASQIEMDRTILIDELNRLRKDDYLIRKIIDEERHYTFKYEIIRNWWKINKSY